MRRAAVDIAWLYLGEAEAKRAREIVRQLSEQDTIDELGLGVLRDALADRLFPGTATPMTRARYLIFIPTIYRFIEIQTWRRRRRRLSADLKSWSRVLQDGLRQTLDETYDHRQREGIIGFKSKENLERFPSAIYWNALKELGILQHDLSEDDYIRTIAERQGAGASDRDDMGERIDGTGSVSVWDPRFPYFRARRALLSDTGRFRRRTAFDLTPDEARYLLGCYGGDPVKPPHSTAVKRSLIAYLLKRRRRMPFTHAWDVAAPPDLQEIVHHAQRLSLMAKGAMLQYDYWVVELRRALGLTVPDCDLNREFLEWWEAAHPVLEDWQVNTFIGLMHRLGHSMDDDDERFLTLWMQYWRAAPDAKTFLSHREARGLVRWREDRCKGASARLTSQKALRIWNAETYIPRQSEYEFTYRSRVASEFVCSIVRGLSRARE